MEQEAFWKLALMFLSRKHHAQLNQLILSRLPLCLPPHTARPDLYATGLLHFAPIYFAFEAAWQLLSDYEPTSELALETAVVLSSLIHLYIPPLLRTERLRQDLSLLLQQPPELIEVKLRHPDGKQVRDFVRHIKDVACYKPHALIAYTWVMYMALFNGGRWIREQLSAARDFSWTLDKDAVELTSAFAVDSKQKEAGLSFWHFEGAEDGDDIKTEFKARLVDVGAMLNAEHKADIVAEASQIFERCVGLILELDTMAALGTQEDPKEQRISIGSMRMAEVKNVGRVPIHSRLSHRLRHSEALQLLIAIIAWVLQTTILPFTLIRPVAESASVLLEREENE